MPQKYDIIPIKILFCLYFNTSNRYILYKLLIYFFFSIPLCENKKNPLREEDFLKVIDVCFPSPKGRHIRVQSP